MAYARPMPFPAYIHGADYMAGAMCRDRSTRMIYDGERWHAIDLEFSDCPFDLPAAASDYDIARRLSIDDLLAILDEKIEART